MSKGNTLNENSSFRELLNQFVNSEYRVKEIVAAYLGVKPEQMVTTVREVDR